MSDATAKAISLPFDEAIRVLAAKVNVTSSHWSDIWGKAHSRSFAVAGAATGAIVADFREAVTRAIADGESLGQFRKRFDAIVETHGWEHAGKPGWRARVIYETNLGSAYAAGRYAEMTEPGTVQAFPFWQYVHSGKKHFREQHKAWNGTVLRADDPFWSWAYPPNGYHCGCWVRPLTGRDLVRQGKSGADPSPPRVVEPYVVRKTGEVKRRTAGIDPGFDHNPGQEWLKIRDAGDGLAAPPLAVAQGQPAPPKRKPAPPPWSAPRAPGLDGIDAVDQEMRRAFSRWRKTLTEAEVAAIRSYKGSGYAVLNGVLRGVAPSVEDHVLALLKDLDASLARASAPRDMEVLRGVTTRDPFHALQPGDSLRYDAFASFSAGSHTPEKFASDSKRIIVAARVRKGHRGAGYIHDVPVVIHNEHEFLFRPGSLFKCLERIETAQEIRIVVEAVNEPRRRARLAPRRAGKAQ